MNLLRQATTAVCWNLHALQEGAALPLLEVDAPPVALLELTRSWLPDMVGEFVSIEGTISVDLIHPASRPGPGHEAPQPVPVSVACSQVHSRDNLDYLAAFIDALEQLRPSALLHAQNSSDQQYTISALLAATALTTEVRLQSLTSSPGHLVVYIPDHLRRDPGTDQAYAQSLVSKLPVEIVDKLPVYQRALKNALDRAARRVEYFVKLIANGIELSAYSRAEFKDLVYFLATQRLARSASQHQRGERIHGAMIKLLSSRHMAGSEAAAAEVLKAAKINFKDLLPQVNYNLKVPATCRFHAITVYDMKEQGLLRPAVFEHIGESRAKCQKIIPHLKAAGFTIDEIADLCGEHYVQDGRKTAALIAPGSAKEQS